MTLSLKPVLLLLIIFSCNAVSHRRNLNRTSSTLDQGKLIDNIFKGYNKLSIPKKGLEVFVRLVITGVEVETKTNEVTIDGITFMRWKDNRLTWTPDISGEDSIRINSGKIWQPDIVVFNSKLPGKHARNVNSVVHRNGVVKHAPLVSMKTKCVMDLSLWPFDTQKCVVKLGSRTYDSRSLKITVGKKNADIYEPGSDDTITSQFGQWQIEEAVLNNDDKSYSEAHVNIHVTLKRNAPAYIWTAHIPGIVIAINTLVMFILPPAHGEKLLLGVVGLVLCSGLMGSAGHAIHYSPTQIPKFVQFLSTQMTMTIVATVISAIMILLTGEPNAWTMPEPVLKVFSRLGAIFVLPGYCELAHESANRILKNKLSADEDDLSFIGHFQLSASPQWLLFAGVIDRFLLIVYLAVLCTDLFSMFFF